MRVVAENTGPGGGRYTGPGGGLYTGPGGGLYTGPGGGMYTGPDGDNTYRSNIPPWPVLADEAEARGLKAQAAMIRDALGIDATD
jgi:hypothetical protein